MVVDPRVVEEYRRDGVVGLPQLLSSSDVSAVRSAIDSYVRDVAPFVPAGDVVFEADGASVRNLWRMEVHSPFFASLGSRADIVSAVSALVGGSVELAAVETFNKPALHGSGVPQHQDNAYFCQTPPDMCTVWIAVDAATPENGSVQYARGSLGTLLPHKGSGIPGNSMVMAELRSYPADQVTTAVLSPGDAMVHHCQTVHWSTANTTNHPRCGLLLVYRAKHTETDPALKENYRAAAEAFRQAQAAAG